MSFTMFSGLSLLLLSLLLVIGDCRKPGEAGPSSEEEDVTLCDSHPIVPRRSERGSIARRLGIFLRHPIPDPSETVLDPTPIRQLRVLNEAVRQAAAVLHEEQYVEPPPLNPGTVDELERELESRYGDVLGFRENFRFETPHLQRIGAEPASYRIVGQTTLMDPTACSLAGHDMQAYPYAVPYATDQTCCLGMDTCLYPAFTIAFWQIPFLCTRGDSCIRNRITCNRCGAMAHTVCMYVRFMFLLTLGLITGNGAAMIEEYQGFARNAFYFMGHCPICFQPYLWEQGRHMVTVFVLLYAVFGMVVDFRLQMEQTHYTELRDMSKTKPPPTVLSNVGAVRGSINRRIQFRHVTREMISAFLTPELLGRVHRNIGNEGYSFRTLMLRTFEAIRDTDNMILLFDNVFYTVRGRLEDEVRATERRLREEVDEALADPNNDDGSVAEPYCKRGRFGDDDDNDPPPPPTAIA